MMDNSGRFREVKVVDDEVRELDGTLVENPGLVLGIGETVTLKGREFKVRKITKKDIILRGLPK